MVYRDLVSASRNLGAGAALLAILLPLHALAQEAPQPPPPHWPASPAELEQILPYQDFQILEVKGGVGGVMGVRKLTVRFSPSNRVLKVKWKRAPDGDADGWNNTPRKEIAAYEVQKWFLDPVDYVVPTIAPRCIPMAAYAAVDPKATHPSLPGTTCAFGVFVIWLDDVGIEGPIYEESRFLADPRYAYYMANLNLLTYLIDHEDGRRNNFLTSDDPRDRRIFSIDNGVSFGARVKNWFVRNWNKIRVPALRRETIERLRTVDAKRLQELGVVAELRADADGVLRPVAHSKNVAPKKGSRVEPGWIQLGLTRGEIEDVHERIERLLKDVDKGRIGLF